jgi:hypothetical protein
MSRGGLSVCAVDPDWPKVDIRYGLITSSPPETYGRELRGEFILYAQVVTAVF